MNMTFEFSNMEGGGVIIVPDRMAADIGPPSAPEPHLLLEEVSNSDYWLNHQMQGHLQKRKAGAAEEQKRGMNEDGERTKKRCYYALVSSSD